MNRRDFLLGASAAVLAGCATKDGDERPAAGGGGSSALKPSFHVFSKMFQPPVTASPEAFCDLLASSGADGVQWTVCPKGHVEPDRVETAPKCIGLEYDPMHALFETNLSWTHGFNLVAPWIASIDLKDFHYALAPKNSKMMRKSMVAACEGIVPWKEVRRLVEANGVDPLYIVHFEYDFDKSDLRKSVKSEMDAFKSVLA